MKRLVATLAALASIGVSLYAADPVVPRPAPPLTFTIPGKGPTQLDQYAGKVVLLAFMSTTCPHCQAKSKELTKLQADYGARGLQVIGIATNPNADLLVENFVKDFQVGFPVGFMPGEHVPPFMSFSASDRWVVPQVALIDRKGVIRYQTTATETEAWDKLMAPEALRAHVEELLNLGSTAAVHRKPAAAGTTAQR